MIDKQIGAWNKHDAVLFAATYSDSTELYNFPNTLRNKFEGNQKLKEYYTTLFQKHPKIHCEVMGKLLSGNTAIYYEKITGRADGGTVNSLVTYKVENGKITKVYFDHPK